MWVVQKTRFDQVFFFFLFFLAYLPMNSNQSLQIKRKKIKKNDCVLLAFYMHSFQYSTPEGRNSEYSKYFKQFQLKSNSLHDKKEFSIFSPLIWRKCKYNQLRIKHDSYSKLILPLVMTLSCSWLASLTTTTIKARVLGWHLIIRARQDEILNIIDHKERQASPLETFSLYTITAFLHR